MKLLRATESVTPMWKFSASAIWSTMMLSSTTTSDIGPSNHMPTFVCWMCSPSNDESWKAPPIAFTWSVSMRSRTSPSMAKPRRCTSLLPPAAASFP